jgi:hypothetical protein
MLSKRSNHVKTSVNIKKSTIQQSKIDIKTVHARNRQTNIEHRIT